MSCDQLQSLAQWLTFLGLGSGFLGSIMLANSYFQATGLGLSVWVVFSSLWRGKQALGAARMKAANPENALASLQGVAFLGLSFAFQLGAFGAPLLFGASCPSATH